MDAIAFLTIINLLLNTAFGIWEKARQILGVDAIPEWDDIAAKNERLQAKIDAELEPEPNELKPDPER